MVHAAKSQRIFDHIVAIRAFYCLTNLVSIFSHLNLPPDKAIRLTSSRALLRKPTAAGGSQIMTQLLITFPSYKFGNE